MRTTTTAFALASAVLAGLPLSAQTYMYDAAGRLVRVAYPDGRGIGYSYDDADNLVAATTIALPPAPAGVQARETAPGVRVSWDPVQGATGYIISRRAAGGGVWEEVATVSGNATSFLDEQGTGGNYVYRVAARNANGPSAFSRELGASSPYSLNLSIAGGGAVAASTLGQAAATRGGWASVAVESGSVPYGVAVFSLTQNGVLVSESSVPASPPTTRGRIFIDYRTGVRAAAGQFQGEVRIDTGFGIANPGTRDARILFTLREPDGRVVATGRGVLARGGHTATLLSDLRGFAPDFLLPSNFATATQFGSLELESDQPISMMALRLTFNQRNELLFTSTPVADLSIEPATGSVYFPHFADGGGFTTAILLMNTSDRVQTGNLEFYASSGTPLNVNRAGGGSAAVFPYVIQPGGVFVIESDGVGATRAGWVRLTPSAGQPSPAGAGIFRLGVAGVVVSESGISAGMPTTQARIYVDKRGGYDMGIAIANPGAASAALTVRAFGLDGQTPAASGPAQFALNANGHRADLSSDIVAGLPPSFTGVLDVTSPVPFVALNLRLIFNSRGDLLMTTFPVADQLRPAPSPLIFPHLADGGGFRTELILLGPQSAAETVVRFFDDAGQPLAAAAAP